MPYFICIDVTPCYLSLRVDARRARMICSGRMKLRDVAVGCSHKPALAWTEIASDQPITVDCIRIRVSVSGNLELRYGAVGGSDESPAPGLR